MLSHNVPVKPVIIAITILILAAASMFAVISPSHAASLAMVPGERSGGSQVAGSTGSASSSIDGKEKRPLGELLNPDGTMNLDTGFSGSVDMAGWKMDGGLSGAPRFVPAAAGDENWDARFLARGVNGDVYSLALSG